MSEPRRSTRARAREDAAPLSVLAPETAGKRTKSTLKRKRGSVVATPATPTTTTTTTTTATDSTPQAPKHALPRHTLPLRLTDGQPLPTLPDPQPLELAARAWQDIQQSGVLSASLQQSRAVWVSGLHFRTFHRFFAQPKKVGERTDEDKARQQRQKELHKNFPQVGPDAQLVIEPHTFNIRLYGPREVPRSVHKKPPPTYGSWPNHNQPTTTQHPHPHQQQHQHQHQHHFAHQPYQKPHAHAQPQSQPRLPPPPPPQQPKPKPVAVQQRPSPATSTSTPTPTSTPAPDPVIHMLAARAGTDPELKAVMKIVAAGQATKEQLEFFQIHIQELTDIVAGQKEAAAKAPINPASKTNMITPSKTNMATPSKTNMAPPPTKAAATPLHTKPNTAPPPPPPHQPIAAPPRPVQPALQHQPPQNMPKPYNPSLPPAHQQQPPLVQPHPPPHPNTYNSNTTYSQPPQYHTPQHAPSFNTPPPPRTTYRPLVFSFVEGNQDMFYFPSYSFMEWLPNGSGAKLSFLITKPKPTAKPKVVKPPPSTPAPSTPTPTLIPSPTPVPTTTTPTTPFLPTPVPQVTPVPVSTPAPTPTPTPAPTPAPFIPPPRIEDFDEKHQIDSIDLYQPVTVLLLTDNYDIKNALARAIRPPDVVERYMEDVFDRCRRAEETYLAFRLPREGGAELSGSGSGRVGGDKEKEREKERDEEGSGTPVGVGVVDGGGWGGFTGGTGEKKKAGRPRKSFV